MGGIFGGGNSYQQQQQIPTDNTGYPMVTADWQPPAAGSDFYATGGQGGGYPTGAFDSAAYGTGGDYGGGSSDSGGGGILNWLGSEKGQRAMQQLGGFSSGLLQGSAPSLQPRNFSTGLGAGMAGMQQAGSQYYQDALRRAQAQEAQAKVADLQTWSKVMQGAAGNATGLPPGYMPGAPGSGTSTPAVANPPADAGGGGSGGGGSGGGGLGGWGPLAQPAIAALNTAGVSPAGQQAIIGHGLAEGGFNVPWNVGDNGNSFGHWQFNKGGELPGYLAWAQGKGNPQDTGLQAQYVAQRVEEIHPGFSKVTDPAQAMAMVADFERYKGYQTNKRLGFLADAQKAMGGGELEPRLPIPDSTPSGGGARLADTAYQAPTLGRSPEQITQALGGGPGVGILPRAPAMPAITQPVGAAGEYGAGQSQPTYMAGGRARIAPVMPAAVSPETQVAAATPSAAPAAAMRGVGAGAPNLVEGDSIAYGLQKFGGLAGNPKGGRNPEEVLQNIDSNLKSDPNYYRGKTVMLSSGVMNGPGRIDLVPDQIQRIQDAGGKVILAGVDTGKFVRHNDTLAQMAADAGVPFAGPLPTNNVHPGPDGYRQYLAQVQGRARRLPGAGNSGSSFPVGTTTGTDPGAGELGTPAAPPVGVQPAPVPAVMQPAPPAPPPSPAAAAPGPGLAAGNLIPGVRTPAEIEAAKAVAASAPLPATPAPPPAATQAPGGPPPPPVPGAAAAGPNAMPGAIAPPPVAAPPRPLPMPNLGQVQPPGAGGLPPYDVEAARRAQVLSIAGAATGHQVPAYLAEQAGLPNKAVEQQWAMQKQLYGAQLQAAQSQWNAASELQKQQIAHSQGMETEQYKSELGIRAKNFELGRWYNPQTASFEAIPGAAGVAGAQAGAVKSGELGAQLPYDVVKDYNTIREVKGVVESGPNAGAPTVRNVSQATLDAEQGRPPPPAVAAAMGRSPAPAPGATVPPGAAGTPASPPIPGTVTGLSPVQTARIEGDRAQWQATAQQHAQANNLRPLLDQTIEMANKTPSGWAVPITQFVAKGMAAAGLPVTEGMSNAEAMKSISQALIPTVRQPGSQSNAEMTNYLSTVPGLSQSPAGRIQIANMNKAMIDRLGEIAEVRRNNLGAADLHEKLATLDNKPLFTPVQHAVMVAGMGQRPPTDAEFDLLPIGIDYTNAKGQRRTKTANRTPQ